MVRLVCVLCIPQTAFQKMLNIDLEDTQLTYVSGGFSWATSAKRNPNGVTLYLDEVRYEFV